MELFPSIANYSEDCTKHNEYCDNRFSNYVTSMMRFSSRTHLLSGHSEKITSLHMDPRFIVTGCWDGTIRIWCRHSGNCLAAVTPHAAPVTSVFLDTPVDQKAGLVRQHIFSASRFTGQKRFNINQIVPEMDLYGV